MKPEDETIDPVKKIIRLREKILADKSSGSQQEIITAEVEVKEQAGYFAKKYRGVGFVPRSEHITKNEKE